MKREMLRISALRANVSREEAIAQMRGSGLTRIAANAISGPVRMIADAYVPFRLFSADIFNAEAHERQWLAIDAVEGALDAYGFDGPIRGEALTEIDSRNVLPGMLSGERAAEMLKDKVRRMIFGRGFFRMRDLRIEIADAGMEFYVPYWLAFRGHGARASVMVMDAVRRRMEGAKARAVFREWLVRGEEKRLMPEMAGGR